MIYSTSVNYQSPYLQYDGHDRLWKLVEDYTQEWFLNLQPVRLVMIAGYEYDKASTPKWAPRFVARHDEVWEGPALWHDRLYQEKGKFLNPNEFRFERFSQGIWKVGVERWSRKQADNWLEEDGRYAGASVFEAAKYKFFVQVYPPNWFKGF